MIDRSIDFTGKTICIIGGSSGIGNATAQAFRGCGAEVHVTGTRASKADYNADEGSDLEGLTYHQLDAGDDAASRAAHRLNTIAHAQRGGLPERIHGGNHRVTVQNTGNVVGNGRSQFASAHGGEV